MFRDPQLCKILIVAFYLMLAHSLPAYGGPVESHPPRFAVFLSSGKDEQYPHHLSDLVEVILSQEKGITVVSRSDIDTILAELGISLSSLLSSQNQLQAGKLLRATHLVIGTATPQKIVLRIISVDQGKILKETEIAVSSDIHLAARAASELIISAWRGDSSAKPKTTIGVCSFKNTSITDRSDKLCKELELAVRNELLAKPQFAVVERQYPSDLLDELDLTKVLSSNQTIAEFPTADIMLKGDVKDESMEYEGDTAWDMSITVSILSQSDVSNISFGCASDQMSNAVSKIIESTLELGERTRRRVPACPESEITRWREYALTIWPISLSEYCMIVPSPNSTHEKYNVLEAIRAWENILLLSPDDAEARICLASCLAGLYWSPAWHHTNTSEKVFALKQCIRATELAQNVIKINPNDRDCRKRYNQIITSIGAQGLVGQNKFILKNSGQFPPHIIQLAKAEIAGAKERYYDEVGSAIANIKSDPARVIRLFINAPMELQRLKDEHRQFACQWTNSPSAIVRFMAEFELGMIEGEKRKASVGHFVRVTESYEDAVKETLDRRAQESLKHLFEFACGICVQHGQIEIVRKALKNNDVLKFVDACFPDRLDEALKTCETFTSDNYAAPLNVVEVREIMRARDAGSYPGFDHMTSLRCESSGYQTFGGKGQPQMAVGGGKLWFVLPRWQPQRQGKAFCVKPEDNAASAVAGLPLGMVSVTVVGDNVFFGGASGIFRLDFQGNVLKHYSRSSGHLPSDPVNFLSSGDRKLYFGCSLGTRTGIAVLDLAKDTLRVLAPTSKNVHWNKEPVFRVTWIGDEPDFSTGLRIMWDSAAKSLYVAVDKERSYVLLPEGWRRISGDSHPVCIISDDLDTVRMTSNGKKTSYEFLRSGQKVECESYLLRDIGVPAWDERCIWQPSGLGVFQIERDTGELRWFAHQHNMKCVSAVRLQDKLYVATDNDLIWCRVSN